MLTFNLAPIPKWTFHDRAGSLLIGGFMRAYRDTVRSDTKPVYQDSSGLTPYSQPITFDSAGAAGPFYWASDENYYLEIYNSDGQLQWTVPGYNAPGSGGAGPTTNNIDFTNFIRDAQFTYPKEKAITTLTVDQKIGNGEWYFLKNNTSATDSIKYVDFLLGETAPPFTPPRYFEYECTLAGAAEVTKDLEFRVPKVRSFENQTVSFAYWGKSPTAANTVEIFVKQNFGTGGAPSAEVFTPVVNHVLAPAWGQFAGAGFVVPTAGGKTLGTNDDDYIAIVFRLPRDSATTIDLTNMQMNLGPSVLPFDYLDPQLTVASLTPALVPFDSKGQSLVVNANGILQWGGGDYIGKVSWSSSLFVIPPGHFPCDGLAISRTIYAGLFSTICLSGTADTVNGSPIITNATFHTIFGNDVIGTPISGPGIPAATTILSVTLNTLTLSNNATATASTVKMDICPWGVGDGTTTFNVPEIRGTFPRAYDDGRGIDVGRVFGKEQAGLVGDHTHLVGGTNYNTIVGSGAGVRDLVNYPSSSNVATSGVTGGGSPHNRPINNTLRPLIRAL